MSSFYVKFSVTYKQNLNSKYFKFLFMTLLTFDLFKSNAYDKIDNYIYL